MTDTEKLEQIRAPVWPSDDDVEDHDWRSNIYTRMLYGPYMSRSRFYCLWCGKAADKPSHIEHTETCWIGELIDILGVE